MVVIATSAAATVAPAAQGGTRRVPVDPGSAGGGVRATVVATCGLRTPNARGPARLARDHAAPHMTDS